MTNSPDNWQAVVERLRRALGLQPPTPDEADEEMRAAGKTPMSDEEIEAIVRSATAGDASSTALEPDLPWVGDVDIHDIARDSELVLNRNRGEDDEEIDRKIERLREEALEDDDDDEDEQA